MQSISYKSIIINAIEDKLREYVKKLEHKFEIEKSISDKYRMKTTQNTTERPSHYYFVACNLHHAKTHRIFTHRLEQAFKSCYCKYRDDNIISYDVFTPLDRDCIIILLKHLSEGLHFTDRDTLIVYFPEVHVENNSLVETDRERHVIIGHLQVIEDDRLCRKIEQFIRSYGVDRFFDSLKDENPE